MIQYQVEGMVPSYCCTAVRRAARIMKKEFLRIVAVGVTSMFPPLQKKNVIHTRYLSSVCAKKIALRVFASMK